MLFELALPAFVLLIEQLWGSTLTQAVFVSIQLRSSTSGDSQFMFVLSLRNVAQSPPETRFPLLLLRLAKSLT